MDISIFYIQTYVYNFKRYWHNREKEICPPSKDSISGNRCERSNMAAKCGMFMTWGIASYVFVKKNQIWLPNKEYLRDHTCERTNIIYTNVKYFGLSKLHGDYTHVYSVQSHWNAYTKQNMSAKQVIHKWSLMIKNKCGCQIHNMDTYFLLRLKPCWLTC